MRTLLISKFDENYLEKCAVDFKFAYGIIIGQKLDDEKIIAVHLAKSCEEDVDSPNLLDAVDSEPSKISDIDTAELSNQWISASRMIPGSFNVLGVFVTSQLHDISQEKSLVAAKALLQEVDNLLVQSNTFQSAIEDNEKSEYLLLLYSALTKKVVCKSYSKSLNGGILSPLDCRIVEKNFEWYTIDSNYEFNDIFPIMETKNSKINIEKEFHKSIELVRHGLATSEIFLQNECIDDEQLLDMYVKRKYNDKKKEEHTNRQLKASIFLPVEGQSIDRVSNIKVHQFDGTIRFSGVISSRIWCNSKTSLGQVKNFIRTDILRSLGARVQIYCDGLTEPNISADGYFSSEPPRRVYFNLPGEKAINPVQFSEYIFPGEAPTVAVAQAKQILDIDLLPEHILTDLEGLPDDLISSEKFKVETRQDLSPIRTQFLLRNRTTCIVAFMVLLTAIGLSALFQKIIK